MTKIILPIEVYEEEMRRNYWSGIFDGEGTLPLCENGSKLTRSLRVSISQNNWPFLHFLKDKFNAGGLVRDGKNWRINFNKTEDIQKFLNYIEPYTHLKHKEVVIALMICEVILSQETLHGPKALRTQLVRARLEQALEKAAEERNTAYLEPDDVET